MCIIARNAVSENHHNRAIFSVTDISVVDNILRIICQNRSRYRHAILEWQNI